MTNQQKMKNKKEETNYNKDLRHLRQFKRLLVQ